jgi:alpha,alpha-trehalase
MVMLASEVIKRRQSEAEAQAFIERMLPLAVKEHETVWMGTQQPHNRKVYAGLSRYFDINFLDDLASCESGWDHTTRCDGHWLGHLPVDLNAILYMYETDIAEFYRLLGQDEMSASWKSRAEQRQATMQELMWDSATGFFLDYDFEHKRRNAHPSLAGFYPLWAGLASESQAERMVREWLPRFEFPGGLVTTLTEQKGKQWAYPNGWAPLHWLVTHGLDRYGYAADAVRIREKWYTNCEKVFWATGCLWEKYNVVAVGQIPESGVYGSIRGFGWSNAVTWDFAGYLGKR